MLAKLERQPSSLPLVLEEYMDVDPEDLREVPMKCALSGTLTGSCPLPPPFYASDLP